VPRRRHINLNVAATTCGFAATRASSPPSPYPSCRPSARRPRRPRWRALPRAAAETAWGTAAAGGRARAAAAGGGGVKEWRRRRRGRGRRRRGRGGGGGAPAGVTRAAEAPPSPTPPPPHQFRPRRRRRHRRLRRRRPSGMAQKADFEIYPPPCVLGVRVCVANSKLHKQHHKTPHHEHPPCSTLAPVHV